ncbi:MAG: hypothetical protein DMF92_07835 [Acidobacteria bacterium]|nr:MAG: hypothetical protein DMF92_07835 [Acidobacteriota bacterium]
MGVVADRVALPVVPGVRLAPFALLRIAAVPYRSLRALAPPKATSLVRQALNARQEMERLRPLLEDLLYRAIPAIVDRKMRGTALRFCRDVHNGRRNHGGPEEVPRIVDSLPDEQGTVVRDWSRAQVEATESLAAAQAALIDETESHTRARLWALSTEKSVGPALALSSPELFADLLRTGSPPPQGLGATKAEKSLLRYLIRAALKTSPFSTFMHVARLEVALDGPSPALECRDGKPVSVVTLNRGTLARIYKEASGRFSDQNNARFHVNTTIRELGRGRLEALVGQYVVLRGRPWRQERVSRFHVHPDLAQILLQISGEYSWSELVRLFAAAGLDSGQARAFVAKLFERGLIWPEASTDGFDRRPEVGLLRNLESSPLPAARAARTAVAAMHQAAMAFVDADGESRAGLMRQVRSLEKQVLTSLTQRPTTAYRNVVLEDSSMGGITGAIGDKLSTLFGELGTFLRTHIGLRPDYMRLRDAFVHMYGTGGTCRDLVGFMTKVGDRLVTVPEPGVSAISWRPEHKPTPAARGATIGVTAYVQVVAPHAEAAAAGDALLVVNRVFEGVGWLTARYSAGSHADHRRLRTLMRVWLAESVAPREPIDLMIGGECNDLQAHPRLTSRVFAWPGEPLLRERTGVLRAEAVALHHNAATGFLELTDADARPVSLVYLGSVLPSPAWGIPYALTVLAQPHYILRPDFSAPARPSSDVAFNPRRREGQLVVARARWAMRTSRLQTRWFRHTGAQRLLAVAEECRTHGIPECFFARAHKQIEPAQMDSALDARKPLWIDTRNPFCLDLFERIARDVEWVVITEALPDLDHSWVLVRGERHVSEFQVEMVVSTVDRV